MASIKEYLENIANAKYGQEVRGSIHDAISAINDESEQAYSTAVTSASSAAEKATEASNSALSATEKASEAATSASDASGYKAQCEAIVVGLSGALIPMGTVAFENLPALADCKNGYMYNINNEFITTSDFVEGAGHIYPVGTNVYKIAPGKWDCLAGINLSPDKIGAVASSGGEVADTVVTFTSNDCGHDGDTALLEIDKLATGEKISALMQKISRAFTNMRYIIKLLGTKDISGIGDGTVTGAINTLNSNLDFEVTWNANLLGSSESQIATKSVNTVYIQKSVYGTGTQSMAINTAIEVGAIPSDYAPNASTYYPIFGNNISGGNQKVIGVGTVTSTGKIFVYLNSVPEWRMRMLFMYIIED